MKLKREEAEGLRQDSLEVTSSDVRKARVINCLLLLTQNSKLKTQNWSEATSQPLFQILTNHLLLTSP